jgi:hypothetical protein
LNRALQRPPASRFIGGAVERTRDVAQVVLRLRLGRQQERQRERDELRDDEPAEQQPHDLQGKRWAGPTTPSGRRFHRIDAATKTMGCHFQSVSLSATESGGRQCMMKHALCAQIST